jgi:Helix-turn-helix domain
MKSRLLKDYLLKDTQVAERLGVPRSTVKSWRKEGYGPSYIRYTETGPIFYDPAEVERFKKRGRIEQNAESIERWMRRRELKQMAREIEASPEVSCDPRNEQRARQLTNDVLQLHRLTNRR